MKRSSVLCVLLLISLLIPLAWAGEPPKHRDPAEISDENPDAIKLYELYSFIYGSISRENFTAAADYLGLARLVYSMEDLRFILSRYNQLLDDEIGFLNLSKARLDLAAEHLNWFRVNSAGEALQSALVSLGKANATLLDLDKASIELASKLRTGPAPLLEDLQTIRELIDKYQARRRELDSLIDSYEKKNSTYVTLYLKPSQVLVGSDFLIAGALKNLNEKGLEGRVLDIYVAGSKVASFTTVMDGLFALTVKAPFIYFEEIKVVVSYLPIGVDAEVYRPSSASQNIRLVYYTPRIEAKPSDAFYPGKISILRGKVSHDGRALKGFTVYSKAFGEEQNAVTDDDGFFMLELEVPSDTFTGQHPLTVETFPSGVYGPSVVELIVNIVQFENSLSVDAPSWAISGGRIEIKGIVKAQGTSLSDCSISIRGELGSSTVVTGKDGLFSASVSVPLILLTKQYGYTLAVKPKEAWIRPVVMEKNLLVANVLTILCSPVILGLFLVHYRGRIIQLNIGLFGGGKRYPIVGYDTPQTHEVRAGNTSDMERLYEGAVSAVAHAINVSPRPSETIREYLGRVEDKLNRSIFSLISRLILTYERWLYGPPHKPRFGVAKELYMKIMGMLGFEGK